MTIPLPTPLGTVSTRWQVSDWIIRTGTSSAAGTDGKATLEFPALGSDEMWLIDHATIRCDSVTDTALRWYDSAVGAPNLVDGSDSGNFDVGDWPSGLLVRPSSVLIAQWTGCSTGAVGRVRLQARQLLRAG
jgi:hypothetical protein